MRFEKEIKESKLAIHLAECSIVSPNDYFQFYENILEYTSFSDNLIIFRWCSVSISHRVCFFSIILFKKKKIPTLCSRQSNFDHYY